MLIGLTGNIGSGKSTIAKIFEILGCKIFDSDKCAKEAYFNKEIKLKIIELLSRKAYLNEYEIDKNYISSKIFSNTDLLLRINGIIHPFVINSFKDFAKQHKNKIIIKESALLFEVNLTSGLNKIITVMANDDVRLKRIIKRDGMSKNIAQKKINSQMKQELKAEKSDFIISNNNNDLIIPQVISIFNTIAGK